MPPQVICPSCKSTATRMLDAASTIGPYEYYRCLICNDVWTVKKKDQEPSSPDKPKLSLNLTK